MYTQVKGRAVLEVFFTQDSPPKSPESADALPVGFSRLIKKQNFYRPAEASPVPLFLPSCTGPVLRIGRD
jgi:hypothetical protein